VTYYSRDQIRAMSYEEVAEHWSDVQDSMAGDDEEHRLGRRFSDMTPEQMRRLDFKDVPGEMLERPEFLEKFHAEVLRRGKAGSMAPESAEGEQE
jgi:hypothetical protein